MSQIKVTYLDHCGSDLTTVNAARVSFGKHSDGVMIEYDLLRDDPNTIKASVEKYQEEGWIIKSDLDNWKIVIQMPTDGDKGLIRYLAKHEHISPFGHALHPSNVKAPIFVARQLVKHKFLRWNEISRRYVDDEPEFYVPDVWRGRSADKKQGSDGIANWPPEGTGSAYQLEHQYPSIAATYHRMLDAGVAPEQARMVLPQSTMTEFYWSGSLDAFASMCKLRLKEDTQYESRLVAKQISEVMGKLYPVSWDALVGGTKMKVWMVDPDSGWLYGFPKPAPKDYILHDDFDFHGWLVDEGYPQEKVDYWLNGSLGYVPCRMWEQEIEDD